MESINTEPDLTIPDNNQTTGESSVHV